MTPGARLVPPSWVSTGNGALLWRPGSEESACPSGLLATFSTLRSARDEDIAKFARSNGVLELCREHGLPQAHCQPALGERTPGCRPARSREADAAYTEDLDRWRLFAEEASVVLELAGKVRAGEESRDDFLQVRVLVEPMSETATEWDTEVRPNLDLTADALFTVTAPESDEDYSYWLLRWITDRWFRLGDVRPAMSLNEHGEIETHLTSAGLFGALAVLLAAEVTRTLEAKTRPRPFDTAICHECGQVYIPRRKPAANRRNYCEQPECKRAALRDAQRDKRAGKSKPRSSNRS